MSVTLEKVVEEVVNGAIAEYEKVIDGAVEEAAKRLKAAEEAAVAELKQKLDTVKRDVSTYKLKLISQVDLEAKREYLQALDDAVESVFRSALEKLAEVKKSERYEKALEALLREALATVGGSSFKVSCSADDRQLVERVAKRIASERSLEVVIEKEPINCMGGVIVSNVDGTVVFDNTLDSRLDRMRQAIRSEIAASLSL